MDFFKKYKYRRWTGKSGKKIILHFVNKPLDLEKNRMLRQCIFFCALIAYTMAFAMHFHDCGQASHGMVAAVVADHCDHEPCQVHRGANYTGSVNFTATRDYTEVHAVLHGGLGFLSLPWPVEHADLCKWGDLPCPLHAGQSYTFKLDMHCPTFAPRTRITAKWELKDEHGANIICFSIPLQIV